MKKWQKEMQIWVAIVFLSCSQPRKAKVSGSNKHKINIAGQQQSLNHNESNNKKRTITVFLSSAKSSSKKRFQAQLSTSLRIVLGDWSCKKVSLWFHFLQSLMMQQRHHCWSLSQLVTLGTFPSQQGSGSAESLPRSIWKSFPPGGETVPLICVFSRKPEQVFFPHRCLCPSTSSVHHG